MKKFFNKNYGIHGIAILITALVLPWFGQLLNWSTLNQIIWLYIVVNGLYMLYFGYVTRKRGLFPGVLVIMPLFFALITTWLLGLVSTSYGFYLALFYFVLSLFTFFGDTRDDPDENLIPVENGFYGLHSDDDDEKISVPVDGGFKS
ncbi:hypothetical protein [Leuconostoc citreum]|uniref:hypothetical protein n=1 Tax=Leuconostoc citreum TaxID=33964 RepID=UPI000BFEB3E5|nr:hypothetical protein [Leuconostoc citreum]